MNLLIFNALSWEQRKLGSISEIKTGPFGSTLHADDYVTDGIPIITTEHFKNGDLPTSKNGLPQVSDEDYKRLSSYVLNEGDIVFSRVGSVDINALVMPSQRHWLFSGRVLRVRPDMVNDPQFLHTVLETETIKADIRSRAVGQTMPSINTEILNETLVMMPQLRAEQEQIGQFFYSLNKTITLHQSKAESWKNKKNQLSTISWEQRKLGDLMDVGSVKRVHQSDWRDSGVRFLRARDVVADFNNEEPDDYLYIDQKMYEEYSAQSGKVQQGDLLVTGVGTIGIPMLIKSEKPLYFKDGNIIWFKNKNAIDGQFFYYSFISKGIQDFIKESAGIGTVGTYTIDSGKKTPINLPTSIEEQKKIGIYFKNLDHLITLHHRKLNRTQICINRSFLYGSF